MSEGIVLPIPNLKLVQYAWTLQQPHLKSSHARAREDLLAGIEKDETAPYLQQLISNSTLTTDATTEKLLKDLLEKNTKEQETLDSKHKDAQDNLGETEVADAFKAKAQFLARIGEKEKAVEAYEETISKTAGLASKIDLRLAIIRVYLFHSDLRNAATSIEKAQTLIDEGGDWDRRNRLKTYKGLWCLAVRDFDQGATLLLDTLSTFTSSELLDYSEFIALCVIAGTLACSRKDLKKKIIDSPEVLATLPDLPHLQGFAPSLYNSQYSKFFLALASVEEHHLLTSSVLAVHTRYYIREMKVKAYTQFLESYRSVTLASLGHAFGVSEDWIDADLARFIAAGRLSYTIDKVNGVVETSKVSNPRSIKYEQIIKSSDLLLNNVQRLSRVIG